MTHIELLVKCLFLVGIGICFFFFEGIVILNLFKKWGNWWSNELFESAKDRNGDGKISFMERTFPRDGGHFFKRLLIALIGAGMSYYQGIPAITYLAYSFVGWWIASAVFDFTWTAMRRILAIAILISILPSCSVKKAVNKSESKNEIKIDSTVDEEKTTTSTLDTLIQLPGDSISGKINFEDTCEQVIESNGIKIIVAPGSGKNRKIKAISKPKEIPVKVSQQTKEKWKASFKKKQQSELIYKEKQKESTGIPWSIWLMICIAIAAFLSFKYAMR